MSGFGWAVEAAAEAMEAANEERILVDFDVMAGEMVVDWESLAKAAVEALQLTEETRENYNTINGRPVKGYGYQSRVVGPWRTAQ